MSQPFVPEVERSELTSPETAKVNIGRMQILYMVSLVFKGNDLLPLIIGERL